LPHWEKPGGNYAQLIRRDEQLFQFGVGWESAATVHAGGETGNADRNLRKDGVVTAVAAEIPTATESAAKAKKPSTAHLKAVPESKETREQIRVEAARFMSEVDKTQPLSKPLLQQYAEQVLARMSLGLQYTGFTAVCLSNEFWREQLMAIDFSRRLLLLPHCLKHAEGCPADYDEFGLDCRKCGACSIADFKVKAEDLGYKVLVAEGSPIVLKIIVSGHVDGIVGVSCLNVLEKAIDKVLSVGVPSIAVPLLSSNCKNTSVDFDWVDEVIGLRSAPPPKKTKTYVHLMRAANHLFNGELEALAPRQRAAAPLAAGASPVANGRPPGETPGSADPLCKTEEIAYEFLCHGGKRFRPFITLAAYDALVGGRGTLGEGYLQLPAAVKRAALAIETFHKASLVHDDIEDDDSFRYGQPALHKQYGVGTAINIGDYLIGMGYRLVGRDRKELGGAAAADILSKLAEAHMRLSEGQGAELLWRDAQDKCLTPLDALKIYTLKTAPAFEAALYAGLRLAGPAESYEKLAAEFSKHLGIAFQILNDFKDWQGDCDNKLLAGQDTLAARPTLLLALALEAAAPDDRQRLLSILRQPQRCEADVKEVRAIFNRAAVFDKAESLIEKYQARAEAVADDAEPTPLRELLYFLVDTILEKVSEPLEDYAPPDDGLVHIHLSGG
jgi:geranylgeranyl diphosphate synthase type II